MYKPTYCCDCGEKIERLNWNVLTNRRFCEFCETEHNLDILLRKAAVVLLTLFGFFGIGSYLVSGDQTNEIADSNQGVTFEKGPPSGNGESEPLSAIKDEIEPSTVDESAEEKGKQELVESPNKERRQVTLKNSPAQKVTSGPVFFCGAATKKGTPCSRRVKGGGRCWQHEGKEALLSEKELRINP